MKFRSLLIASLLSAFCAGAPLVTHAQTFAIHAANVTMPSSGNGSSAYTVSQIPMTGTLSVVCAYSGPTTQARIPNCSYGPLRVMSVTAGETVTGAITFFPYGVVVPARDRPGASKATQALEMALVVPLLLGLGCGRRIWRRLALVAVAGVAVSWVSACGGSSNAMTPGTYQYTITADNEANPVTPLGQGVSTTISVSVR